jgi:hypothetical protein
LVEDGLQGEVTVMARTPPSESYRYNNSPPDVPAPSRGADQLDQRFGWLEGSGAATSNPRGGDWVQFGDHSEVGRRLFTDKRFTTGMQNGRVRKR